MFNGPLGGGRCCKGAWQTDLHRHRTGWCTWRARYYGPPLVKVW